MNDQVPVRMRNALAYAQKQFEPLAHIDAGRVPVDGNTLHILHHQKRPVILCVAGIDDMNDRGVMESGQQLPLL